MMTKLIKVKVRTGLEDNKETSIESDVNERKMVESAAENNDGEVEALSEWRKEGCVRTGWKRINYLTFLINHYIIIGHNGMNLSYKVLNFVAVVYAVLIFL